VAAAAVTAAPELDLLVPADEADDPGRVGPAFARLADLRRHGFPVPDFFCVPADALAAVLADLRCDGPDLPAGSVAWAAGWHARLAATPLPAGLAARLLERFDALVGPDGRVAVRAGAVTEDAAGACVPDVPRADLTRRVAECWASAFTARAVHSRLLRGLDPCAAGMAVCVQAMVPAAAGADVAELTRRVEAHCGGPYEVAGVVTAAGEVHLVAARPAAPAPSGPRVTYASAGGYPGVSCALTHSVAAALAEAGQHDQLRRRGVPARQLRRHRPELRGLVAQLDGRVYHRTDSWDRLDALVPARPRVRQAVALLPGVVRSRRRVGGLLRWWDRRFVTALAQPRREPAELVADYQRLWAEVGELWGLPAVNERHGRVAAGLLAGLTARWAAGAEPDVLAGMLRGGRESRSAAAARSTIALAERVRRRPDLRAALAGGDDRATWAALCAGRYGDDLAAAALRHVHRYGDRGPRDLKLETETVRSAPWTLLPLLRAYADQPAVSVGTSRRRERESRAAAERHLRRHCPQWMRRELLRVLYATLRECVRLHEDARFCRSQLVGLSRDLLLALGAELASAGLLGDPRDVLDLTVDEVLGAFQGTVEGADLAGLAAVRRARREVWLSTVDRPAVVRLPPSTPVARSLAADPVAGP
jgi:rifampicin phosphotransferase